jgi:hypothetical protein
VNVTTICELPGVGGLNPVLYALTSLLIAHPTRGGWYNPCSGVWTDLKELFYNNAVVQWQTCNQNYNPSLDFRSSMA